MSFYKKFKTLKNDEILLFIIEFNKIYDIEKHMCVKSNNYLHNAYSIIYHYQIVSNRIILCVLIT